MILSEIIHSPPARSAALEADGVAERERHVVAVQDAEVEVGLPADARVAVAQRRIAGVRPQAGGEQRGPQPLEVEARRPGRLEHVGRRVPLDHLAHEVLRAELVDAEARERVELAVALDRLVVDVVVAEAAEIEIGHRAVAVAVGDAAGGPQPDRRMRERQREAEIELAVELRRQLAVDAVAVVDERPLGALLVVDRAERAPHVGVAEADFAGEEAGEVGADVLGVGQRVDLVVVGEVDVEVQPPRLVVDQRPVVAQLGRVALAAALGRVRTDRRSPSGSTTARRARTR